MRRPRGLPPLLSLCLIALTPVARFSGADSGVVERRLWAMGTWLSIQVTAPDRQRALAASEAAVREISRVEDLLSTWKPGGPLERINRAWPDESVEVGGEAAALLREVFDWSGRTGGAFDPTVAPLVRVWGLRGQGRVPEEAELAHALAATGREHFAVDVERGRVQRFSRQAGLDEGAWGKGYALDRASAALRQADLREAYLDLGGQVSVIGRATVAVADPRDRSRVAAILEAADASVSTSGDSERSPTVAGRRIGHLLDPHTGQPALDFGSATAVCPTGLAADILSTAFFVLGPARGLELSERLRRDGFANDALFLVLDRDRLKAFASPGLRFRLGEQ